jgi:hypothetical protein
VDWDNIGAGFKKAGKVIKDTVSAGMKGASDAASAYGDWYEKKGDKNRERSLRQAKARVEYESQYEPLRDELLESRESRLEDQAKLQELEYREEKEQIRRESAQRKLDLERQEQDIEYQEREYKQQERLARLEDRRLRAMGVAPQPRQQNRMPQSRPQNGGFRPVQNNMRAQQQQQPQRGQPVSRQNQNINPLRRMNSLDFMGSVSGVMGMQNTSQSQPQPQFQQPMAQNPPRSSRNRPHPLPPAPVSGSRRTSKKSRGRARHDDYDDYEEDYGDDYDDYDGYEDDYDDDYDDDDSGAVRRVARKRKPARSAPPKKKSPPKRKPARSAPPKKKSPPKRKPAKKTSPRKKPVRRASSTRK